MKYDKTLLLCLFFGMFGAHRYYNGKKRTGTLMLCTLGGFGVGWLIDLRKIMAGNFRDINSNYIVSKNTFFKTFSNYIVILTFIVYLITGIMVISKCVVREEVIIDDEKLVDFTQEGFTKVEEESGEAITVFEKELEGNSDYKIIAKHIDGVNNDVVEVSMVDESDANNNGFIENISYANENAVALYITSIESGESGSYFYLIDSKEIEVGIPIEGVDEEMLKAISQVFIQTVEYE